jgi:hypothetical protein
VGLDPLHGAFFVGGLRIEEVDELALVGLAVERLASRAASSEMPPERIASMAASSLARRLRREQSSAQVLLAKRRWKIMTANRAA